MKRWSVAIPWFCSVIRKVEAETREEALTKAEKEGYPSICHQCSKGIEIGEQDIEGEPDVAEVE